MKKLSCLVLAICLVFLCSCASVRQAVTQTVMQTIQGKQTVSIILCQDQDTDDCLTEADFSDFKDISYRLYTAKDEAEQYTLFCEQANADDTAVLVADLKTTDPAVRMVATAKAHNIPLLLCGVKPSSGILNRYDKCWYIGFDAQLVAEMQAGLLIELFRSGQLHDLDEDFQYSTLTVQTTDSGSFLPYSYAEDVKKELSLAGISIYSPADAICETNIETALSRLGGLLLPTLQTEKPDSEDEAEEYWLTPSVTAEIILCGDVQASVAAIKAKQALAKAAQDPEQESYATKDTDCLIVCYGQSEEITDALQKGLVTGSVAENLPALAEAIHSLCSNIVAQQTPTLNTDYYLTDSKYIMLDYIVLI